MLKSNIFKNIKEIFNKCAQLKNAIKLPSSFEFEREYIFFNEFQHFSVF